MLNTIICEDNPTHMTGLETFIIDYAKKNNLPVQISTSTASPLDVLNQASIMKLNKQIGLYFLDLDLKCDISGFDLAVRIRQYDPRAFIVIVTADTDSQMLAFRHGIEIMDYIIKGSDGYKERIEICVETACERLAICTEKKNESIESFEVKLAESVKVNGTRFYSKGCMLSLNLNDIFFIESYYAKPHFLNIHTRKNKYVARMLIKDAMKPLGASFLRCGSSCIVNITKVVKFEHVENKLYFEDGRSVEVTRNAFKNAIKYKEKLHNHLE